MAWRTIGVMAMSCLALVADLATAAEARHAANLISRSAIGYDVHRLAAGEEQQEVAAEEQQEVAKGVARDGRGMAIDTGTNGASSRRQTFRNIFQSA